MKRGFLTKTGILFRNLAQKNKEAGKTLLFFNAVLPFPFAFFVWLPRASKICYTEMTYAFISVVRY